MCVVCCFCTVLAQDWERDKLLITIFNCVHGVYALLWFYVPSSLLGRACIGWMFTCPHFSAYLSDVTTSTQQHQLTMSTQVARGILELGATKLVPIWFRECVGDTRVVLD